MTFPSYFLANGVARNSRIIAKEALGSWVTDIYGKRYLDMTSGIGALSTGHCHPVVVERAKAQVGTLVHAQQNCVLTHPPQLELLEKLGPTFPKDIDTVFFTNSGSEAIENSMKLVRKATGRTNLISFLGGFHGRTFGCMSVSASKASCRQGYQPLLPGVFHLDYPLLGQADQSIQQLESIFARVSDPGETAAIILEPVLGEGGVYQADPQFVQHLRRVCDQYGILWVSDEVQTGMGRTGEWWGYQHFGVEPDVITFGKGIASGYPLAGVAASGRHFDTIHANGLGGTYNGNVVATAAAVATLEVFQEEDLVTRSNQMGRLLAQGLHDLKHPLIEEIRQYGLMLAIDLRLSPTGFKGLMEMANHHNVMILTTGIDSTVRLLPPLTISEEEIDCFLEKFQKLLDNSAE